MAVNLNGNHMIKGLYYFKLKQPEQFNNRLMLTHGGVSTQCISVERSQQC